MRRLGPWQDRVDTLRVQPGGQHDNIEFEFFDTSSCLQADADFAGVNVGDAGLARLSDDTSCILRCLQQNGVQSRA